MNTLEIRELHANAGDKPILHGLDLTVGPGEIHAIMGPNGSGKSTLANVLVGRPGYTVTKGSIRFDGHDLLELEPEQRAREGIFLAFQYPVEIPGVNNNYFLKASLNALRKHRGEPELDAIDFLTLVREKMKLVEMPEDLMNRAINVGFSGGEKKRNEVLQMSLLQPRLAVLDEPDSGLDVDGIRQVAAAINAQRAAGSGVLVITHYMRILEHLDPDRVHVLFGGQVLKSGGPEIARELEEQGYGLLRDGLATARHPLVPEEA
jgi:Fe-S cluster assembly ATP-binding protein